MIKTHQFDTALWQENPLLTDFITPKGIRFPSPAKLNLFLYINGKRLDGYHELQTLFQFVNYGDWLTIDVRKDSEIILTPKIPHLKAEDNLIYRAAKLLQNHANCTKGATIHLDKVLPMGGGIGGGSSNAATTLVALNYLWNCQLNLEELAKLGLQLGADVPIFIYGKSALAEGVGEHFTPCTPKEYVYVVLKPDVAISTKALFSEPDLPRNTPKRDLNTLLSLPFANDFQKIACKCYPEVEHLLHQLIKYAPARLTGTGSCVFAECESAVLAEQVFNQFHNEFSGFVARGSNISPLHVMMKLLPKNETQPLIIF